MSSNTRATASALPKCGKIMIEGASTGFSITLQKISPDGARLRQAFPFPVPSTFSLVTFNSLTNSHDTRSCEKIWQRGDLVNARFL